MAATRTYLKQSEDSRGAYAEEVWASSAARTASGDSGVLGEYANADSLRVQLDVTAAAGTTPTLNVVIEDTVDGTNWNTIGTFSQKTAVAREVINVSSPFARQLRVKWTVAGTTPSFTFSVNAAVQGV